MPLFVRCSIACSFNLTSCRLRKERDCPQSGLKSLGSYYYTLLRTADPVLDRGKANCIPCLGQRDQKTIPYPAAHPRIAQVREYPPPGGQGETWSGGGRGRGKGKGEGCKGSLFLHHFFTVMLIMVYKIARKALLLNQVYVMHHKSTNAC